MSPFYSQLSYYSGALGLAIILGGLLPLTIHGVRRHLPALLSFSAGAMLGAAFLHLLPNAYDSLGHMAGLWVLAGFVFLYVFEKFVTVHICEALDCSVHTIGVAAFVGLAIHALTEGIALGTGMLVAGVGTVVFISILVHKVPAALALTSILLNENYRRRSVILLQAVFFLMVPLGALLVQGLFQAKGAMLLGPALGFSTGTFLHIALSDILPEVHRSRYHRVPAFLAFLLGLLIMGLVNDGH